MEEDESQYRGRLPYSFREECEFFKVPRIGSVKVERLGQRLNVPTQGRRVVQTGTKPFSLTAPGSDPQPGIEPRPHWWETDVLTARPPEHPCDMISRTRYHVISMNSARKGLYGLFFEISITHKSTRSETLNTCISLSILVEAGTEKQESDFRIFIQSQQIGREFYSYSLLCSGMYKEATARFFWPAVTLLSLT